MTSIYELNIGELPSSSCGMVLWEQVFQAQRPLRIEIGVGNSPFLIELALRSKDFNYLGFEYSRKRVLKFLKKVEEAEATNIRMLQLNACLVLRHMFAAGSVDHFYINHPDPWPKRRHSKNRLVTPSNAMLMRDLLCPGGGISLRTDVVQYSRQMLEVLDGAEGLQNLSGRGCFAERPLEDIPTPYEKRSLKEGHEIYYLEYIRALR